MSSSEAETNNHHGRCVFENVSCIPKNIRVVVYVRCVCLNYCACWYGLVTGEDQHRYVFDLNHVISCRELKRPVINFTQAQKDMIKSKCQYSTFVDISAVYIYS
jgi:hypothetical protein